MMLTTSSSPNVLLVEAAFDRSLKLFISRYTAHLRRIMTQFKLGKHALRRSTTSGDG
jgi:hypothetical protein